MKSFPRSKEIPPAQDDPDTLEAQTDAERVGAALRHRRQIRTMTLKRVAERSGISVGMLSQVERGLAAPSIKTLRAICTAMDMPVNWLFHRGSEQESPAAQYIVTREGRRALPHQNGLFTKELLTPDTQRNIQMLRFVLEPTASSGEAYNNSEGGKCGVVLSGTLGLALNDVEFRIRTGDSFAFPSTDMVRYWAIGDERCEVIWVVAPATL